MNVERQPNHSRANHGTVHFRLIPNCTNAADYLSPRTTSTTLRTGVKWPWMSSLPDGKSPSRASIRSETPSTHGHPLHFFRHHQRQEPTVCFNHPEGRVLFLETIQTSSPCTSLPLPYYPVKLLSALPVQLAKKNRCGYADLRFLQSFGTTLTALRTRPRHRSRFRGRFNNT